MNDSKRPAAPKMESSPPAKRVKAERSATPEEAAKNSSDDPKAADDESKDEDDVPPPVFDDVWEHFKANFGTLPRKSKQGILDVIAGRLKREYDVLKEHELWVLIMMSYFAFSEEFAGIALDNCKTGLLIAGKMDGACESLFPDGGDYNDWINKPRSSFLEKEDMECTLWKGRVCPMAQYAEYAAMMNQQHLRSLRAEYVFDEIEDVTKEEYDAAFRTLATLFLSTPKEQLIRFEMEEDLYNLAEIRNRIIEESGLKNMLEELAEQVADGLDPPSWFESIKLSDYDIE